MKKLKVIKAELAKDGFIIDGIFGGFAKGESKKSSDIDLLYHVNGKFLNMYGSFRAFKRIEEIKNI